MVCIDGYIFCVDDFLMRIIKRKGMSIELFITKSWTLYPCGIRDMSGRHFLYCSIKQELRLRSICSGVYRRAWSVAS